MKKLFAPALISLLFLFLTTEASAQKMQDIVYLKNGSIIRGTILEMIPGGTIKIETADRSIFIYKMEEVERTAREEMAPIKGHGRRERGETVEKYKDLPSKGYFVMAQVGPNAHIDFGVSSIDATVGIINGFYLNEFFSLGVGAHSTQYTFNSNPTASAIAYPVFLDARFYIPKGMVCPMFSFQVGYGFVGTRMLPTEQNAYIDFIPNASSGGSYMAFSGGVRVSITKTLAITAEGSPTFQAFEGEKMYYVAGSGEKFEPAGKKTVTSFQFNVGVSLSLGKKNIK